MNTLSAIEFINNNANACAVWQEAGLWRVTQTILFANRNDWTEEELFKLLLVVENPPQGD